jgi:hypothetical protein
MHILGYLSSLVVQYIKSFYKILGGILILPREIDWYIYLLHTCENGTIAIYGNFTAFLILLYFSVGTRKGPKVLILKTSTMSAPFPHLLLVYNYVIKLLMFLSFVLLCNIKRVSTCLLSDWMS